MEDSPPLEVLAESSDSSELKQENRDADVENRFVEKVGEGEGGMN